VVVEGLSGKAQEEDQKTVEAQHGPFVEGAKAGENALSSQGHDLNAMLTGLIARYSAESVSLKDWTRATAYSFEAPRCLFGSV
jgi:hypothetical protein